MKIAFLNLGCKVNKYEVDLLKEKCEKAKEIISLDEQVISVEEIQYHSYGENGVFTAEIKTDCATAEEFEKISVRLQQSVKEKFCAEIYMKFGGRDEN